MQGMFELNKSQTHKKALWYQYQLASANVSVCLELNGVQLNITIQEYTITVSNLQIADKIYWTNTIAFYSKECINSVKPLGAKYVHTYVCHISKKKVQNLIDLGVK